MSKSFDMFQMENQAGDLIPVPSVSCSILSLIKVLLDIYKVTNMKHL